MTPDNAPAASPYVSIVFTGRNDGYGGDFVQRFLATLQFNSRELCARGIVHEFVLVEWAPPPGAPLLVDLVDAQCPSSVTASFRDIVVDRAYHPAVTLNPKIRYQEFLAKNVGVRRARGEYVIATNCDIFLGRHILERLRHRDLEPGTVYRAARWDVTSIESDAPIDWTYLDDPANLARPKKTLEPPYFSGAAGDFMALDRATFERVGGFNEVYRLARVGIDGNFLVHARSSGFTIVDVGGPVYHIDHAESYRSTRAAYAGREQEAHYGDERWPADVVVYRNRPQWGLHGAPERPIGPRRTFIEFSWDAVPPLVDLSGVVLPARVAGGTTASPHAGSDARGAAGTDGDAKLARALTALAAVDLVLTDLRGTATSRSRDAFHAVAAVVLDRYRCAMRDVRAVAGDARRSIEGAPGALADVQTFAHRRRRKADKIAARRPPASPSR